MQCLPTQIEFGYHRDAIPKEKQTQVYDRLHGPNQWPGGASGKHLRVAVDEYMTAMLRTSTVCVKSHSVISYEHDIV